MITSGNNVSVVDTDDIALGASDVDGTYAITSTNGSITNSGALDIEGVGTFTVTNGQSITLDNGSNDFTATPVFAASSGTIQNVEITDTSALVFGALTVAGNLTGTISGGAVTQSGVLVVPGTTSITATGQNVTFSNASNNFATIGVTGADVTIRDTNAVILAASTVSGDLSVTAAGAITDSGNISVDGSSKTATFNAGSSNDITLNNSNDFKT